MDGPWGRVRLTPAHDSAQVVRVPQKQRRIRVASGSPEPLRQPRLVPSDVDLEPVVATASARVPPWEVSSFLFERVNTLRELLWRCASILPVLRRPRVDSGGSILLLRHFILLLVVSLPSRDAWLLERVSFACWNVRLLLWTEPPKVETGLVLGTSGSPGPSPEPVAQ